MDNPFKSANILSFCTGMRGIERGIERACLQFNWPAPKTVAYVEIEAFIIENLVQQMEAGILAPAPIWSNLKTFPEQYFRGKIHGIVGGYPCQPFSLAGKQQGTEDPRHLWPYIKSPIRTIRPFWCFFENVRNHLNIGYETVRAELQEMGYNVREGIYSAQEAGAPHKRDRLFILAIMGNTYGYQQNSQQRDHEEMFTISEQQRAKIGTTLFRGTGFEFMDHSNLKGLERHARNGYDKERWQEQGIPTSKRSLFPAKYGEDQMEWECPRTIEPVLGCTINGYNFREDLLRMYGNGVVEQTAEIAFIDLLRKHLK